LNTLKTLMKQISLDYFFERVMLKYSGFQGDILTVIKLLIRGQRMYECIDNILLIFVLIGKR
jgi:hypothetical protein